MKRELKKNFYDHKEVQMGLKQKEKRGVREGQKHGAETKTKSLQIFGVDRQNETRYNVFETAGLKATTK